MTPNEVAEHLEAAAKTMRRMPSARVAQYGSSWPQVVNDSCEAYGYNSEVVRLGPPTSAEISAMDRATRWLLWCEADEARIVWARANGVRWKVLERRMKIGRKSLWLRQVHALMKIAHMINHPGITFDLPYKVLVKHNRYTQAKQESAQITA